MFDKNSTMFNREFRVKRVIEKITILQYYLENVSSINLQDGNLIAENFVAGLLNIIFGWKLVNLNSTQNIAGIDLGDYSKKIAVQVTRQNDSQKIQETIKKFFDHKHNDRFDDLYIFLLANKKQYTSTFDVKDLVFNVKENIIDIKDVIAKIKDLPIDSLTSIESFLEKELYALDWKAEAKKVANFINREHSLFAYHRGARQWAGEFTAIFGNDGFEHIQDGLSPIRRQVDYLRIVLKKEGIKELAFTSSDNKNTWVMLVDSPEEKELQKLIWICFEIAYKERTNIE